MPEYDGGERFDLRGKYVDNGWVDEDADVMKKVRDGGEGAMIFYVQDGFLCPRWRGGKGTGRVCVVYDVYIETYGHMQYHIETHRQCTDNINNFNGLDCSSSQYLRPPTQIGNFFGLGKKKE